VKVRIEMTVEVDPAEWVENYGCDRADVRADVREYVRNTVENQLAAVGMLITDKEL
jgi:hypothetical protein